MAPSQARGYLRGMATERHILAIADCAKCGATDSCGEIGEVAREGELRCAVCGHPTTFDQQLELVPDAQGS
jgi:hypothetical protein